MKRQIDGFSKYYEENGKIYSKRFKKVLNVNSHNQVNMIRDNGIKTTISLRRLFDYEENFKYKKIEKTRNVKYKQAYGRQNYLFCQDVEDQYKVFSKNRNEFLTPRLDVNHLVFCFDGTTMGFYRIIWEYQNQKKEPKNYVIHHLDLNPRNDKYDNLYLMKSYSHFKLHKQIQFNKNFDYQQWLKERYDFVQPRHIKKSRKRWII